MRTLLLLSLVLLFLFIGALVAAYVLLTEWLLPHIHRLPL